jgi:hypothetical protein
MARPRPAAAASSLSARARLVAGWFLLVGAVGLVVAGHDLLFASDLGPRVLAAAVFAICLGLVVSSVGLEREQAWAFAPAVVSGFGATLASGLCFVAQWSNYIHDARLFLWAGLAASLGLGTVVLWREGRVDLGLFARRRVQALASLLSIGAVVSVAQFWNAAVRVPPTAAPSVTIVPRLKELPGNGPMRRLHGTIQVRNTSETKVWVLGALYNVLGGRAYDRPKSLGEFSEAMQSTFVTPSLLDSASRHVTKGYKRVIETGQLLGPGTYFVPGDEATFDLAVYAPKDAYDLVRLEATLLLGKDSLVLEDARQPTGCDVADEPVVPAAVRAEAEQEPAQPCATTESGVRSIVAEYPVRDTSWFGRLFRGDRVVHTQVWLDRNPGFLKPTFYTYIERDRRVQPVGVNPSAYSLRMQRLYGLGLAEGSFELSLK